MIRSYRVEPGAIVLEVVESGPDDPACCPTQRSRETITLAGGRLAILSDTLGVLSIAQLIGTTWRLAEFRTGVPADDDVTTTAAFEDGRMTGLAGCNRYVATLTPSEGNALELGPVVATRMACEEPAMSAETRYLRALEHVNQYGFVLGRLALTYQDGDDLGTLLFDETTK
jgi:heat shock protein HslJ